MMELQRGNTARPVNWGDWETMPTCSSWRRSRAHSPTMLPSQLAADRRVPTCGPLNLEAVALRKRLSDRTCDGADRAAPCGTHRAVGRRVAQLVR